MAVVVRGAEASKFPASARRSLHFLSPQCNSLWSCVLFLVTTGLCIDTFKTLFFDACKTALISLPVANGLYHISESDGRIVVPFVISVSSFFIAWSPWFTNKNSVTIFYWLHIGTTFGKPSTYWYQPLQYLGSAAVGLCCAFLIQLLPSVCTGRVHNSLSIFRKEIATFESMLLLLLKELTITERIDIHSASIYTLVIKLRASRAIIQQHFEGAINELGLLNKREEMIDCRHRYERLTSSLDYLYCLCRFSVLDAFHFHDEAVRQLSPLHVKSLSTLPFFVDVVNGTIKALKEGTVQQPVSLPADFSANDYGIHFVGRVACIVEYVNAVAKRDAEYHPELSPDMEQHLNTFAAFKRTLIESFGPPYFGKCTGFLENFKGPCKLAVGMAVGSLWISIPRLITLSQGRGVWVAVNVAVVYVHGNASGSFERTKQRLVGNGLGNDNQMFQKPLTKG